MSYATKDPEHKKTKRRLQGIQPPRTLSKFAPVQNRWISRAMRTFVAMVMALAVTTRAADMAESSGPQARMARGRAPPRGANFLM